MLSPWEQIKWRPCYKGSKEKRRHFTGGCQEEKKEEETVKMNKCKAEPVSSWCYQRQAPASSMELDLPRVRGAQGEVEEPEIEARKMSEKDLYPIP